MAFYTSQKHQFLLEIDWAYLEGGHNDFMAYKQTPSRFWKTTEIKKQTLLKKCYFLIRDQLYFKILFTTHLK